jgi:peroxiredoxin Q/BCP
MASLFPIQTMRTLALSFATIALAISTASAQGGRGAAQAGLPAGSPAVGDMAPDFTAPIAGKNGIEATPVTLSKLRGKVVVLAFYPGDRTAGCTIQLTKYTAEYTKIFGGSSDVVVFGISKDGLESHASWAKDMGMPFSLISDTAGTVAKLFGSQPRPGAGFTRSLWVIGKDGKITYMSPRVNVNSEDAYTELAAKVAEATK